MAQLYTAKVRGECLGLIEALRMPALIPQIRS